MVAFCIQHAMSIAYSTCAIYHAQQYPHKNPISAPARHFLAFPSAVSEQLNVRKWGNISINIVASDVSLYTSQFHSEFWRQCEYPSRCRACKCMSLASLCGLDRDRSAGSDAGGGLNDKKAQRKQNKSLGLVVWTQPQQFYFVCSQSRTGRNSSFPSAECVEKQVLTV